MADLIARGLGKKANDEIININTTLGTKADQTDLDATNTSVSTVKSEVETARGIKANLNERFDEIDTTLAQRPTQDLVRLKSVLLGQNDMTEEFRQQMAGSTPINAVPADGGVFYKKLGTDVVNVLNTMSDKKLVGSNSTSGLYYLSVGTTVVTIVNKVTKKSALKSITFDYDSVNTIKIKFFKFEDNVMKFQEEFLLTTKVGLNTYYVGIDFPYFEVDKDWYIGYYAASGQGGVKFTTTGTVISAYSISGDVTGNVTMATANEKKWTADISAEYIDTGNILRNYTDVEVGKVKQKYPSALYSTDFEGVSLPTNFLEVGGWTVNNGLIPPATGGYEVMSYYNIISALDECKVRAKVLINDANCRFGLAKRSSWSDIGSSLVEIDCVNNKIILYKDWDIRSNPPVLLSETIIPFSFIAGREYMIEYKKNTLSKVTVTVTDTITGDTISASNDTAVSGQRHGRGWDAPGIIHLAGSYKVTKFEYVSDQPMKPKLWITGDSFIEGYSLLPNDIAKRYSYKIKQALGSDCVIAGHGGYMTSDVLNQLPVDLNKFKPEYALLAVGVNDGVYDTWLPNYQKIIQSVEELGITPILVTITQRGDLDRTAFMTAANDWILNSGYKYLDANLVTSLNNDRVTFDPSCFLADQLHPNEKGHDLIYKRFLVDCPELFDVE